MNKAKTPAIGKKSQQPVSVPRHRFLITLSCIASLLFWYVFTVLMSLGVTELINGSEPGSVTDRMYDWILIVQAFIPLVAGLLSIPLTYLLLRKLSMNRALLKSIVVAMTPAMAVYIFITLYTVFPIIMLAGISAVLGGTFILSCFAAVAWAFFFLKRGYKLFPRHWSSIVALVAPFIVVALAVLASL